MEKIESMTDGELRNYKGSIKVGGKITVEENNRRWDEIFRIEREEKKRGILECGTYNED